MIRGSQQHGRNFICLIESLLVRCMRERGYIITVSLNSGDRVCLLDGTRDGKKLNLTELAKEIIRDLEHGGDSKGSIDSLFSDG